MSFFEKVNKGYLKMGNFNYKNDQISLYCHFNEIIKGPGTSFQFPAFGQKTCYKCLSYSTLIFEQISFQQYLGFKRKRHKSNFHNAMTSKEISSKVMT